MAPFPVLSKVNLYQNVDGDAQTDIVCFFWMGDGVFHSLHCHIPVHSAVNMSTMLQKNCPWKQRISPTMSHTGLHSIFFFPNINKFYLFQSYINIRDSLQKQLITFINFKQQPENKEVNKKKQHLNEIKYANEGVSTCFQCSKLEIKSFKHLPFNWVTVSLHH